MAPFVRTKHIGPQNEAVVHPDRDVPLDTQEANLLRVGFQPAQEGMSTE
jgi:hypothetical protein